MIRPRLLLSLLALALCLAPRAAHADVIIGTLPVNDGLSMALFSTQAHAVGFTMTSDYEFSDAVLRLRWGGSVGTIDVGIYNDNSGKPGSSIAALTTADTMLPSTSGNYTFTAGSGLTLNQGQTYWLVLKAVSVLSVYWQTDYPFNDPPTGDGATWYGVQQFANPYPNWAPITISGNDIYPGFIIHGVPEPATAALIALGGLAMLRRRRDA